MVERRTGEVNPDLPSCREATAWAERAEVLARWTWDRMVNRCDVWGHYRPLNRRQAGLVWTMPWWRDRGRRFLTRDLLVRHYRGQAVDHVVGLHTTSPEGTSRWGAVEIDWHDPDGLAPAANATAALAWHDQLCRLGFRPLLTDSNGRGGYHLRVLFREPVPTARVFAFLRNLVSDHGRHGLPAAPETFPKQPGLTARARYGNWLRLPGRHHTRDHWSRVWDGSRWLAGAEAVNFLLALAGQSPDLLPRDLDRVKQSDEPTPTLQSLTGGVVSPGTTTPLDTPKRGKRRGGEAEESLYGNKHTGVVTDSDVCLFDLPACVRQAIWATQPAGVGQRHDRLFELARRLKALPDLDGSEAILRAIAVAWFALARHVVRTQDVEVSVADLLDGYARVEKPWAPASLCWAVAEAGANPLPACAAGYPPGQALLIGVHAALQRAAVGSAYYLSDRDAGRVSGLTHRGAARFQRVRLVGAEILQLVRLGRATWEDGQMVERIATHYCYVGGP